MKSILMFRAIVIVSLCLYALSYLISSSVFQTDAAAISLLKRDGYGALFSPDNSLFTVGVFMLWLLAAIGLLHFDNWARYLYLGLTIWSLIAAGLYGIRVTAPLEATLDLAIELLDGAILALIFFSPLKDKFVKSSERLSV